MVPLTEAVATRVHRATHGRIRDLNVREEHGRILVRGQAPSQHAKQLALHAALELLPGDRLRAEITVARRGDEDRYGRGRHLGRAGPLLRLASRADRGVRSPGLST